MKPRITGENNLVDLFLIGRYLVAHRPSENWSVHYDEQGQIFCQLWPYRVPTSVYVKMKEDFELGHPAAR